MSNGRFLSAIFATTLLASCDTADEVRILALPPLQRPSAEARAGLPEVSGVWRFAGWDLAPDDSASLARDLPGLGEIRLQTQRLDSIAGSYVGGGGTLPLVGEVRRDSVVSMVAADAGGSGLFLAGEYARDTMWIRLSSLVEPGAWPSDAMAAFVRSEVATTFVRLHGTTPAPPVDSAALLAAAADSAAAVRDSTVVAVAPTPVADSAVRVVTVPPGAFIARGRRDAFGFPIRPATPRPVVASEPEIPDPQPRVTAPVTEPRAPVLPPRTEPVEPPDVPPPNLPPLLGEPVVRDTAATRRPPPGPRLDRDR